MKSLATKLLLLSSSAVYARHESNDFEDIQMKQQPMRNETESKTFTMNLNRTKDYKEIVKDHIFNQHIRVFAGEDGEEEKQETHDTQTETRPPRREPKEDMNGKLDFNIMDSNRMTYYTKVYVGSNQQEISVGFDTMTPVSLINSANCKGCQDGNGFEY
jgi:hypothetical protein